jgi:hypothetical protein
VIVFDSIIIVGLLCFDSMNERVFII